MDDFKICVAVVKRTPSLRDVEFFPGFTSKTKVIEGIVVESGSVKIETTEDVLTFLTKERIRKKLSPISKVILELVQSFDKANLQGIISALTEKKSFIDTTIMIERMIYEQSKKERR